MTPEPPVSLWPDPKTLGTLTDLYQLAMMAGYAAEGMDHGRAVFEMFVRKLPKGRSYLVFAGLEQAVGDLLRLAFSREQADALRRWPAFRQVDPAFFDRLPGLRFEGDLWAVPEGEVVFAGEPLVRVEADLLQAQWVETILLASFGYPTLVASKASRIVEVAAGRPVYDFGARRGHGPHAGMLAARACYLAGCAGTSHVEAALRMGIPCVGTMAHSWVQSFSGEAESFSSYARQFPGTVTLLVDTYDVEQGVRHAAAIEPAVQAIRIDSGDLDALSRSARRILDAAGRRGTKILGSGDLDEHAIAALVEAGAPIDGFGVGTELITSRDAPAISMVYKLVELDGIGRIKLSPGKKTYPMAKQIRRRYDAEGRFLLDHITRADETAEGEALLKPVIRKGALVAPLPSLDEIREHRRRQVARLPGAFRTVGESPESPVTYSDRLDADAARLGVL